MKYAVYCVTRIFPDTNNQDQMPKYSYKRATYWYNTIRSALNALKGLENQSSEFLIVNEAKAKEINNL